MNSLPFSPALTEGIGLTVVHSLWQATLLAGLLWFLSRRIGAATVRYRLAYGTLLAQLLVSVVTFLLVYRPAVASGPVAEELTVVLFTGTAAEVGPSGRVLPVVVLLWLLALGGGLLRLAWSFGRVRRMRSTSVSSEGSPLWRKVRDLADRIGFEGRLRVAVSERIDCPALVGHLKPVLLFPVAMLNQLTPEEAEAVILHELAHLRRYDQWWNLLQCFIEVLFQFHPVVWWIGARIREEREHCCDDLVLEYGPGRLPYARALLYFETQRSTPATAVALTNNPGGLLGRVQRFVHQQKFPYQMKSRLFLLPLLALLVLVGSAAYAPSVTPDPAAESTAEVPTDCAQTPRNAPVPTPTEVADFGPATAATAPASIDTLPPGRHQVSSHRNGRSTEFLVEDGEIKRLSIDGREVPATEYSEHEEMVERMLDPKKKDVMVYRFGDVEWDSDFELPEGSLKELENSFEQLGEGWEFRLEEMGDEFEEFGQRMEAWGEELGQHFERRFRIDGDHGDIYFFNGDSLVNGSGSGRFFSIDSLPGMNSRVIIRGNARIDGDVDVRSDRFSDQEEEIREMEKMIARLEARKAEMEREVARAGQQAERMQQQAERSHELARVQAERSLELAEAARDEAGSVDYEAVVDQLRRENLIPGDPVRKFTLTEDKLKVNGKRASDAAHARMLELLDKRYGQGTGTSFKVEYKSDRF